MQKYTAGFEIIPKGHGGLVGKVVGHFHMDEAAREEKRKELEELIRCFGYDKMDAEKNEGAQDNT